MSQLYKANVDTSALYETPSLDVDFKFITANVINNSVDNVNNFLLYFWENLRYNGAIEKRKADFINEDHGY